MSRRLLLQSILKFREGIKSGTAKVQDIVEDYFRSSGKSVTDEDRAIIMNEFAESAPSNVEEVFFGSGDPRFYKPKTTEELNQQAKDLGLEFKGLKSDTPFSDQLRKQNPDVEITGKESFGELMEKLRASDQADMAKKEGISSLFFRDKSGFDDRGEAAEFIKKMREAGIKNEDIRKIFKENPPYKKGSAFLGQDRDKMILDLEPGKRAATTLARAADMNADTKIKQELLSELDEMKLDKGPRFFNEQYMGYDDFISAINAKKIEVNNAIVDDLEAMGVSDEIITDIMGMARRQKEGRFYVSGEDFVDAVKEELDSNDIKYDVEFYKNYFRELESLMRKPESRFMYGGVV